MRGSVAAGAARTGLASAIVVGAVAGTSAVLPTAAHAACTPGGEPYVDEAANIRYVCSDGEWLAAGDVAPDRLDDIVGPPEAFLPGVYSVPDEMAHGAWMARTRDGAYPPCLYYTFTHDGIIIDAFLADFNGAPLVAELYSPAIASFRSSENCTPWVRVD